MFTLFFEKFHSPVGDQMTEHVEEDLQEHTLLSVLIPRDCIDSSEVVAPSPPAVPYCYSQAVTAP